MLLSEVSLNNQSFRIDSSYFIKSSSLMDKKLRECPHFFLQNNEVVSGPFGSTLKSHAYLTEGVPFVRVQNIRGGFEIQKNEMVYISEEDNGRLKNSQLFVDDVVLSKVGNTIGYYARVDEELQRCNISENNIGIKLSAYSVAKRHYILAFLNSVYGNVLTLRKISGNAQPKLNVSDISEIPIPQKDVYFENGVSSLVLQSRKLKHQSTAIFAQAENLLLDTLGMANFSPSTEAINVKSFKDSFAATGRLDAEYYQPKYEQIMSHIAAQSHARLNKLVSIQKSIEPGSDAYTDDNDGLPFLRVADYSKYGLTPPQKSLSSAFVLENKDELDALKPKKNTILFSKDGSVGEAYCLREDANFITSGAVLHLAVLDPDEVLPEYLTLALNSKLVKMQAERDAGGSIILHWRVGEVENVVVPLVDMPTQEKIAAMVQESFTLKAESERLLDVAKRAVEIVIEQDEDAGMAYIEANS